MTRRAILCALGALLLVGLGQTGLLPATRAHAAVMPDERLDDPALETRAREVGRELRCVVCQSQSIEESDVPLARDLRRLVRERITAGDTDEQVLDYVADRYGDYVRMRPPVRGSTYFLWAAPLLAAAVGAFAFAVLLRPRAGPAVGTAAGATARPGPDPSGGAGDTHEADASGLTEAERRRLAELELKARDA